MKLYEHPEFEQAILRAAEHFADEDYAPRSLKRITTSRRRYGSSPSPPATRSSSKRHEPVERLELDPAFSEDIDIFLDPRAFEPALGRMASTANSRDSAKQSARTLRSRLSRKRVNHRGFGRNDRFSYAQRFGGPGEVANRVLLEAGTASGREPTSIVDLRSYIGQFLE